ncbi:alpha/beta fold hydrolase [Sphingosinicella sp. BN140058]|uniref:alpha/beta fold hydrolase n=1 Tax=Sphingosinicella sp. BN140058 TaxID=1892855 RepID=UPI001011A435|nr:alpha/beta hydrolase [Sphingosinicella sp. BN140058]QAY77076.1 alpha/beta hydrolase [Sphingosinicella sp. BN140058]
MADLPLERIPLSTGISLDVCLAGPRDAEPILFLHGFPESHRTWRNQIADLSRDHFVVAPDQRGYARSDKPEGVEGYRTTTIVADALALMDALDVKHFTLVGHDWGGAAAWTAALLHPLRVKRLVILNAPHPLVFQKSLIEDTAQREASQYIRFFRSPDAEAKILALGLDAFLDKLLLGNADPGKLPVKERQAYLDEWKEPGALTGMLNWYRATNLEVPETDEDAKLPLWTHAPFPKLHMPTLVVWGLKDVALLPIQLEGLPDVVADLRIVTSPTAGHFIPWEEPGTVTAAIRDFLADTGG